MGYTRIGQNIPKAQGWGPCGMWDAEEREQVLGPRMSFEEIEMTRTAPATDGKTIRVRLGKGHTFSYIRYPSNRLACEAVETLRSSGVEATVIVGSPPEGEA